MNTKIFYQINQRKMKKTFIMIVILSWILVGCGNLTNENESDQKESQKDEKLSMLEIEASRLRAGGSIKTVELQGKSVRIAYVKNYEEYKELSPQSTLTKSNFEAYWESGDA